MSYVTGNEFGPTLYAELTFTNGQTKTEVINSASPAILETTIYEYQNNDLIASVKIVDAHGKEVPQE